MGVGLREYRLGLAKDTHNLGMNRRNNHLTAWLKYQSTNFPCESTGLGGELKNKLTLCVYFTCYSLDQLPVLNITVLNYNDQVHVCWVTSAKTMLGFVVEWVNMNLPENPPEWMNIPALDECMVLKHGRYGSRSRVNSRLSIYGCCMAN